MAWMGTAKAPNDSGEMGVIYLIHLERPLAHARHYLGWVRDGNLERRLEHHRRGEGSRLLAAASAAGISFSIVRTWRGDRNRERRMKNRGHAEKCPECKKGLTKDSC